MLAPYAKSSVGSIDELSFTLVALLRAEGHLCNVLTHISSGDWRAVERAIVIILSPRTSPKKLSSVAQNIVELVCDNRGVTGRIMRPFFFNAIERIAGKTYEKRLKKKIFRLRHRMSLDVQVRLPLARRARKSSRAHSTRQIQLNKAAVLGVALPTEGVAP